MKTILKALTIMVVYVLSYQTLIAQKQANIWHFGGEVFDTTAPSNGICIDFSTGIPVQITGSEMRTWEGCASYCDSLGNLLFYTNGGGRNEINIESGHIWNKNNEIMYSMSGVEGGGWSSFQSSVIFEAPGEPNMYYLFTMDELENGGNRGLCYFKIDMSINGGLGGVTIANQNVYAPSWESLCAIKNGMGQNYWVLIKTTDDKLKVYKVDQMGVSLNQTYDLPGLGGSHLIKASPNGRVFYANSSLFNFNNLTGEMESLLINISEHMTFFEFSPNSKYLYGKDDDGIVQLDLTSDNILASKVVLDTVEWPLSVGDFQLAVDGNIYFLSGFYNTINATHTMRFNRITCPNTFAPKVEQNIIQFNPNQPNPNGTLGFHGLPNFSAHLFEKYENYSISGVTSIFEGETTQLLATGGSSYSWNPDPSLSCLTCSDPIASPSNTTEYKVLITDSSGCQTEKSITINIQKVNSDCIYIPNIFSPNLDNQNDEFCLYGSCLKSGTFTIYNRWGEKVFETTDMKQCWDGTYKGEPVNADVFVYKLSGVLVTGEVVEETGDVQVAR